MSPQPSLATWVLVAAALCPAQAFSNPPLHPTTPTIASTSSSTQLHLVPEQGNQLAAAFNAASAAAEEEAKHKQRAKDAAAAAQHEAHSPFGNTATTATATNNKKKLSTAEETSLGSLTTNTKKPSAAKAFVSRIFSLPGAIMGRHPAAAPALVDIPREQLSSFISLSSSNRGDGSSKDDVVLYPLVGFQFVSSSSDGGAGDGNNGVVVKVLPTQSNPACRITTVPDQELFGWYCTACPLESIYSDTYCDAPKVMIEITDSADPTGKTAEE